MPGSTAACTTGTRRTKARSWGSRSRISPGTSSGPSTTIEAGRSRRGGNTATDAYARSINEHYAGPGLAGAIEAALRGAGRGLDGLAPGDLAPVDQFHVGGRESTLELARRADVGRGLHVLDVGGGLGGPARTLAAELGCRVNVLDLTEEYCRVGAWLTALTGLADHVTFRHGSGLDMPFAAASFDVAWTQHSSMNVEDGDRLYGEIRRVLRPGGRLTLHEIMAGCREPIRFPVPWARKPELSFLRAPEALRQLLARRGFRRIAWVDVTDSSLDWLRRWLAASPVPGSLGLHLLLGGDFAPMFETLVRNLEERRVCIVQGVWDRS